MFNLQFDLIFVEFTGLWALWGLLFWLIVNQIPYFTLLILILILILFISRELDFYICFIWLQSGDKFLIYWFFRCPSIRILTQKPFFIFLIRWQHLEFFEFLMWSWFFSSPSYILFLSLISFRSFIPFHDLFHDCLNYQ